MPRNREAGSTASRRLPSRAPFVGIWRITHMDTWDADFRDLVVPAHITFGRYGEGSFQFGAVEGWIDYRAGWRDGFPTIEFSWQGADEMDEACGRGWASLVNEELHGHLFIHNGDDSPFTAKSVAQGAAERVAPKERTRRARPE